MEAASNSNLATVEAIVKKCGDVSHFDCMGRNALHYAASAKKHQTIDFLAQDGIEVEVDKQTIGGVTPLINAVKSGCGLTVKSVLNRSGNPFLRDIFGREPLQLAAGHAEIEGLINDAREQWFVQVGTDMNELRDTEVPPQQAKFSDFSIQM